MAWNEYIPSLRQKAHLVLMHFARHATASDAQAIAGAVSHLDPIASDSLTKELLGANAGNPELLSLCLDRRFTRDLQELLFSPGFEEFVFEVAERCKAFMFAKGESRVRMPYVESFVPISIALQRSEDPLRGRAMDLYERLLDGDAYGSEEAATASLSRA